jgi:hypothetical protein
VLFWRGGLSVSSKQGDVTLCLPALRVWEVWVGKDWRLFQDPGALNLKLVCRQRTHQLQIEFS